jgi:hypothetical protein
VVVVVSAMSKVTDLLLDSLRKAEAGDQADLDANLEKLSAKHREACCGLLPKDKQDEAIAGLESLITEFARIAKGVMMLGERPPRSVDEAIAVGERLSAFLMARHMEAQGIPAVAVNAAELIATDAVFGNATPLMEPTRVGQWMLGPILARGDVPSLRDSTRPRWTARLRSDEAVRISRHRSRLGPGRRGTVDLDRRGWNHERRSAVGFGCPRSSEITYADRRAGLQRSEGSASPHARAAGQAGFRLEQEQFRARKPGTRILPQWMRATVRTR